MLRPDNTFRGLSPNVEPTRPLAPAGNGNGGFSPLFREVSAEVGRFIEQGAGSAGVGEADVAAAMLSLEGRFLRDAARAAPAKSAVAGSADVDDVPPVDAQQRDFIAGIRPWAVQSAQRLGVSPDLVIAHAALESGWGRHAIRSSDGADSHNLFGIKAGSSWRQDVVNARTSEHVDGEDVSIDAAFRCYPDTASAFRDYTRLLVDNPRYAGALNAGGNARAFADGLARGGYATDPAYADKLVRLASQIRTNDY
ncbi:MAG: flagellar assembly peptidoglycan hydrolase FlgJ [Gammaproteobacteria bacterium]|nr:flagellar assembly peptidoglycan hydrolase FlgJ [Gammaproteobacteria bacterium]MBU0773477.1 flagellar assembly peptidoglycan hydrolase FlgJ [Gammaproteobacteria bacterium]MBU0856687.1 flagellar assembly peptidoglycan hydrolase FlgJ [Gammaproteobacteria bacterium]MBU1846783.1 flagellar assembly peptidoglycan hydrolase FlgJ [Gammaproteobacteria bacterium]